MLTPKKVKFRKWQTGRRHLDRRTPETRGTTVAFGSYGLKAITQCRVSSQQIEAGRKALTHFAARRGLEESWLGAAFKQLFDPLPDGVQISLTPGAGELLEWLSRSNHQVALVTGGNPSFQMEKLGKSKLDSFPFQSISIAEDSKKKPYYQSLADAFDGAARDILVCGDRPEMDLLPAHELGFRVFLRRWGRGLKAKRESWMDGEVWNLLDLTKEIA